MRAGTREKILLRSVVVSGYFFCSRADDVVCGVADRCDEQSVPVQCRMIDRSICESFATTSSHVLVGGQVMELSFPLHSFWTMPHPPTPITIPLHPLTATIHDPFPRVCCTLLLLFVLRLQRCLV